MGRYICQVDTSPVANFLENPGEVLERLREEQHDAADDAEDLEARKKELASRFAAWQAE